MVYCTKCGALNADDAKVCVQCGAPLYGAKEESSPYWRHRHMRYEGEYYGYYRRRGAIATMILGLIIIFIGFLYLLSVLYDVSIPWWSIILIFLGVYILARGIVRSRRCRQ
ncbi:MAG TPA: zinc-ribbon domain-containing protein [Candidatus Bathyarchaeia archaeon]|nr:zinc-ribbon domain-containing protein [Candidatus Bathyarchaeia archaeon]